MDGNVAPMDKICDLAEKYNALVMVDECHSAGVVGSKGRSKRTVQPVRAYRHSHRDIGKGFRRRYRRIHHRTQEIIDMLRQRSEPYLFSNSLPPAVVGAGIEVFKMLDESDELHTRLMDCSVVLVRDG